MLKTSAKPTAREKELRKYLDSAREQLAEARTELRRLRPAEEALAALKREDVPTACWWLQQKCVRQRKELSNVTGRNTRLRFRLKVHEMLGHAIPAGDYHKAKEAVLAAQAERDREMIDARIGNPDDPE